MALANRTAHLLRVKIGTDAQDWSTSVGQFQVGYESLESGDVATRGTLVILQTLLSPESLDVEVNPSRWGPGTAVTVEIPNAAGTYIDHPQGHLYILSDPALPKDGQITLELGCWLLWGGSNAPEGDESGVTYGTAETCDLVATRLLEAADIPSASIDLSTWPYSVSVPLPKGDGSYPGQAADLAYSNDWQYLYQDSDGVIRDRQISLTPGSPQITITLGSNDIDFERFRDQVPPFEITRAAGEGVSVDAVSTPITSFATEEEALDVGEATRTIATTESYVYNPGVSVQTTSISDVSEDYRLIPWASEFPSGSGSATRDKKTTTKTWALTGPPHRLTQEVIVTRQARGIVNPAEVSNITTEDEIARTTRTPTYGADGQIASMQTEERVAEVLHDKASINPYVTRAARRVTTTWSQLDTNRWRVEIITRTARIVQNPNVQSNLWTFTLKRDVKTSNDGSTAPPAVELWAGPYSEAAQEFSGEATWVHPGNPSGRTRKDLKQIPYGFSDLQMEGLAAKHRDLAIGRQQGAILPLPITDALLALDYPLFQVNVVQGATTYKYLADGLQFIHEYGESRAACVGILLEKVTT